MAEGGRTCWCIRFQTKNFTGRLQDLNSMIFISPRCLGTGWGHDAPGHYVHVYARSAAEALHLAFGIPYHLVRQWLAQGGAKVE